MHIRLQKNDKADLFLGVEVVMGDIKILQLEREGRLVTICHCIL